MEEEPSRLPQIIAGKDPDSFIIYLVRRGTFKVGLPVGDGENPRVLRLTIINKAEDHPWRLDTRPLPPLMTDAELAPSPSSSPVPTSDSGEIPLTMPSPTSALPARDLQPRTTQFQGSNDFHRATPRPRPGHLASEGSDARRGHDQAMEEAEQNPLDEQLSSAASDWSGEEETGLNGLLAVMKHYYKEREARYAGIP
ncbi:hypothetical protein BV25DRAFT_1842891 [Artomyces pyxidatus]|uniref:Uncharacterized protein n=1 Tax=Artomyces pyxidatus TaxID=48021 RepID=A0ACB8SIG5_9AGAM|nr:hypothetical protein BV25DRAFT_1842891 [Artomyces pyxidatus]